jgi:hypothetical protein
MGHEIDPITLQPISRPQVNAQGSQQVLAALGEAPVITLKNGIRIANFSSPHPFRFTTGEELPACSAERARLLMLEATEVESLHGIVVSNKPVSWIDIRLSFTMNKTVSVELTYLCGRMDVDVVLAPLPVRDAAKEFIATLERCDAMSSEWAMVRRKARTIRVADRVTKTIFPDRFCV